MCALRYRSCVVISIMILSRYALCYCFMLVLLGEMIMFDQNFLFRLENATASTSALCFLLDTTSAASKFYLAQFLNLSASLIVLVT